MPKKWAVLVVHGVGDTGPGVTVDTFLSSLKSERPRLKPDGHVEVHLLREMPPLHEPHSPNTTTFDHKTFPMHVRRAAILPRKDQPDGAPEQAVFAEVYWADLSTLRLGLLNLVLGLLSSAFSCRYLADQAAIMPATNCLSSWSEKLTHALARWIRFILHLAAYQLSGPIAGLSGLLAFVMFIDALVYPGLSMLLSSRKVLEVGLSTLVGACGLGWLYASRRTLSNTWKRFWMWFGLAAIFGPMSTTAVSSVGMANQLSGLLDSQVILQFGSLNPNAEAIVGYSTHIFIVLQAFYALMIFLIFAALLLWAVAYALAPDTWRPGLSAAVGASIVQLGLWLAIMPPLMMLGMRTVHANGAQIAGLAPMETIQIRFAVTLVLILAVAGIAVAVVVERARWTRAWLGRNCIPPPYPFPTSPPDIARLLVNAAVIGGIIAVAILASVLFVIVLKMGQPRNLPAFGVDVVPLASAFSSLIVMLLIVAAAILAQGLRDALHILTDVINHFYRRDEAVPFPWGKESVAEVQEFETQQRIEHRFKAAISDLLEDPDVTHLTVVSHSQGTMIAIDVFSLTGLTAAFRQSLTSQLKTLEQFYLVTMGSPLTHLYGHYFPARYPPLTDQCWGGLKHTIRQWINIYRVDDYVGTHVGPVPSWKNPAGTAQALINVPIDPGGHVAYWRQPAVFSLDPVREVLPGA